MHTLLDGFEQGTTNVVALGTSAAARAAWHKVRAFLSRRHSSPDPAELTVLSAEPGQEVSVETLLSLLRMLSPAQQRASIEASITVHGDYVGGDYVAGDKVAGDKNITVYGDYGGRDRHAY
jgi:hypothetical protein